MKTAASKAYDEATAPARKAYHEATAPARKAFHEATAQARKAYDEAKRKLLRTDCLATKPPKGIMTPEGDKGAK